MRLIDADVYAEAMREKQEECKKLIEKSESNVFWSEQDHWKGVYAVFAEAKLTLDDAPTVDAVPVKHGQWKKKETFDAYDIYGVKSWALKAKCSECGFVHHFIEAHMCYSYCPNCGAKMDGERRESDEAD